MGKTGKNMGKGAEARETIVLGEYRLTGHIDRIEKFKGYLKFGNRYNSWTTRVPPSMFLIIPANKDQAKEIGKILKQIEKEGYKVLEDNWRILENYGIPKESPIVSRKSKKSKKSLIQELRNLPREERARIISELLEEGD